MSNASHQSTVGKTIAWRGPSRAGTTTPLPTDLLQSASKRLALLAIVMSALVGVWIILNAALQLGEMTDLAEVLCYGAAFAISATVFVLARSGRLAPQRKLDVGLVYLVAIAAIGLVFRLLGPDEIRIPTEGASEACIIILLFPVLVPNTPGKVFTASLLAASMDPLGVALAGWAGKEMPTWTAIAGAYFWNYLCVGLAVVSSHVLYGLGREVSRAREMGAYRLTEKLGEGGMGEVWKARHHLLARDAAIKIIHPEQLLKGDEEAGRLLRRFEREAQATARLQSPYSVELYDFGVTEEGTFFYVMELLDGLDLDSLVRRFGPLPSERVVRLMIQACHSLADAHAQGLIHRDVKPANIFVCRKGRDVDFVKVLDFGLVTSRVSLTDDPARTVEQVVLGTPAYMPPEMIRTETEIDARADLYSLGCVAYWLLTGHPVFEAKSAMDVMIQHVNVEPDPPSSRSELEIDSGLETIVLGCLKKERDERPASAAELMERLENLAISRAWTADRSRQWWKRHVPGPKSAPAAEAVAV